MMSIVAREAYIGLVTRGLVDTSSYYLDLE